MSAENCGKCADCGCVDAGSCTWSDSPPYSTFHDMHIKILYYYYYLPFINGEDFRLYPCVCVSLTDWEYACPCSMFVCSSIEEVEK